MMKSANHNIQKVFLEVNTQTSKKAYYLKDTIDDFLKEHLFPYIENYLNSLELDSTTNYQIEDLQLSLSVKEDMKIDDMIPKIKKQLDKVFLSEKEELFTSQTTNSFKKLNDSENKVNTLLYFLEHGNYPWWVENTNHPNQSVEALLYDSIESSTFLKAFKQKIGNTVFRERTILQVSNLFLSLLVLKISSETKKSSLSFIKSKPFLKKIAQVSIKTKSAIWNLLIDFSLSNTIANREIEQTFIESLKSNSSIKEIENKALNQIIEKFIKANIIQKISFSEIKNIMLKKIVDTKDITNSISEIIPDININDSSFSGLDKESNSNKNKDDNPTSKQEITNEKESNPSEKQLDVIFNSSINNDESKLSTTIDSSIPILNETISIKNDLNNLESEMDAQEGAFYVENAGLILLHPFLKSFFEKCSLLDDNQKIINPTLAIHLLHYLATGREKQYEHFQLMEKFLCVMPLKHPINREVILNNELKENAQELLEAVLMHLPMLKSTSVGLFQNEFLQRSGKLLLEKNTTKLIIEQKTQDLLLKNIPWNISVVKLPWHKRIFFVDW